MMTRVLLLTLIAALAAAMPGRAQAPPPPGVDDLLERVFGADQKQPAELRADFAAELTLKSPLGIHVARGTGTYAQWRRPGEKMRQRVMITKMEVPLLLRPFEGYLKTFISEKVEGQVEQSSVLHEHDVFLLDERPGGMWVLAGVRRDIVTAFMTRYGRQGDANNTPARRAIARWMYTRMRDELVRPGGSYLFRALVDAEGNIHDLTLRYDWGPVNTRVDYVRVGGSPVWRKVVVDSSTEFGGWGRVSGLLALDFSNHCLNNCGVPGAHP
ncbi:MAG: hypothetical protein HY660_15065 [Armatimonadetes bacterium]|nr:hypothetical protein [Armatimonadota bacterium]